MVITAIISLIDTTLNMDKLKNRNYNQKKATMGLQGSWSGRKFHPFLIVAIAGPKRGLIKNEVDL